MKYLLVLALFALPAHADVITEFGMGYKIPETTSLLMQAQCHVVKTQPDESPSMVTVPYNDRIGWFDDISCGGDNPIFVGWPIAWEKDFGVWRVRAGWFHFSHWFDGGNDRELHMDALTTTATFNWTKWAGKRKGK